MSLLMEALRKAEEAKRKGIEESGTDPDSGLEKEERLSNETDEASPLSTGPVDAADSREAEKAEKAEKTGEQQEPIEPVHQNLLADFDTAIASESSENKPEADNQSSLELVDASDELQSKPDESSVASTSSSPSDWPDLEIRPIANDSETQAVQEQLLSDEAPDPNIELEREDATLAALEIPSVQMAPQEGLASQGPAIEGSAIEESTGEESLEEDQTLEAAAWKSRAKKLSNPKDYRKILLLVIPFLLLVGGGVFWYLVNSSQTPTLSPVANRGFLGDSGTPESSSVLEEQNALGTPELSSEFSDLELEVVAEQQEEVPASGDVQVAIEDAALQPRPENTAVQESRDSSAQQTSVFSVTPSVRSPQLESLHTEASSALHAGYKSYAREQYEWLLTAEPHNTDALMALAGLDSAAGNVAGASDAYARLLELDPANPVAQAGLLNLDRGDSLSRESRLRALASQYPDVAPLSFALGNLFASERRWNDAEGAYTRALIAAQSTEMADVSPDYAFNLAVALDQLGKPAEAYTYYREALVMSNVVAPSFDLNLLNNRIRQLEQRL